MRRGTMCIAGALGALFTACLDFSPFDPGLCRTGEYEPDDGFSRRVGGVIRLDGAGDADLSACSVAQGVELRGRFARAPEGLQNLERVGSLVIDGTAGVVDLAALARLAVVEGTAHLRGNQDLARLALPALRRVGRLVVEDNPALLACEIESLLAGLERRPEVVVLDGVPPCGTRPSRPPGGFDRLLAVPGAQALLQLAADEEQRLLVVTGAPTAVVDTATGATQPISGGDEGAVLSLGPDARLGWVTTFGGQWAHNAARPPLFRVAPSAAGEALYLGWAIEPIRVGPSVYEPAAGEDRPVFGLLSAGDPTLDLLSDGFGPPLVRRPVALAASAADAFAFVALQTGSVPRYAVGVVDTGLDNPACPGEAGCLGFSVNPALSGGVVTDGLRASGTEAFILLGRSVDADAALPLWPGVASPPGVGFAGILGAGAVPIIEGTAPQDVVRCVAAGGGGVSFVIRNDRMEVRPWGPPSAAPSAPLRRIDTGLAPFTEEGPTGCGVEADGTVSLVELVPGGLRLVRVAPDGDAVARTIRFEGGVEDAQLGVVPGRVLFAGRAATEVVIPAATGAAGVVPPDQVFLAEISTE